MRRAAPILVFVAASLPLAGRGDPLDTRLYASLLERYTHAVDDLARVRVDYAGLRTEPDWKALVTSLAEADPPGSERPAQLAFWINAYNILAIDLVRAHYPVESIRDIGSWLQPVWKQTAGRAAGEPRTLAAIEHEILRPLGDFRIHAAIVCASLSCPALRREPYESERLDAQLDDAMRTWLADPRKGARLEPDGGVLHLSRIFDWFEEDFEAGGGVLASIRPFLPVELAESLRGSRPRIRFLDYDWRLNAWSGDPA